LAVVALSRIGELLVSDKIITHEQLQETLAYQKIHGGRVGSCLVALGYVSEDDMAAALSRYYGVPAIDLSTAEADLAAIKLVPREIAIKHHIVPIAIKGTVLTVASADPSNLVALDELRFRTGCTVEFLIAPYSGIRTAIEALYAAQKAPVEKTKNEVPQASKPVTASKPSKPVESTPPPKPVEAPPPPKAVEAPKAAKPVEPPPPPVPVEAPPPPKAVEPPKAAKPVEPPPPPKAVEPPKPTKPVELPQPTKINKAFRVAALSRIGELLVSDNVITFEQLQETLAYQKVHGGRIGSCLVALGHVSEDAMAAALSRHYGVPAIDLTTAEVDLAAIKLVSQEIANKHHIVPIAIKGTVLTVAIADPNNLLALDEVRFSTGYSVEVVVAPYSQIRTALDTLYAGSQNAAIERLTEEVAAGGDAGNVEVVEGGQEELDLEDLERASADSSITRLVNLILMEAVKRGASDAHVEPYENEMRVRYRVDGELELGFCPPLSAKAAVISRLKVMSKLDISEKRRPQDGRIKIRCKDKGKAKELDFRVSTLPTLFGEKVVMRLLDKDNLSLELGRLGFEHESLTKFEKAIHKPFGIILVTGPTGSGKTNTLYSAISQINEPNTNIMTAEDPVEFVLPGINQTQIQEQIGSTFATTLRAFLRQDPDVILVGEIRDGETATIAVKAALTGHLVLSTLHTNDAASAVSRLVDMGIEPFLLSTSVNLICAQRLVRRICKGCKTEITVPQKALRDAGFTEEELASVQVSRGTGCSICHNSGYKGRVGLFEVMEIDNDLKEMIAIGKTATDLKRTAIENGMITLRRSGLIKVSQGLTTMDEVLAETVR